MGFGGQVGYEQVKEVTRRYGWERVEGSNEANEITLRKGDEQTKTQYVK